MKFAAKIVGAVFLLELLFYPLLYFFVLLPNTNNYSVNLLIASIRIIGCSAIGLLFAHHIRSQPINEKKALWISLVAGLFGIIYLFSTKLYVSLIDFVWWGAMDDTYYQLDIHPVRVFLSENLDKCSIVSYMCLIVAFHLGRLWFSKKANSL